MSRIQQDIRDGERNFFAPAIYDDWALIAGSGTIKSDPIKVTGHYHFAIQVTNTTGAPTFSFTVEESLDPKSGANAWSALAASPTIIALGAVYEFTATAPYLRLSGTTANGATVLLYGMR
jgi:hypothetical protein